MPLPLPNLDDRRWADLVDEGRALIPRYAPAWTDHNVHDPGITLLELFAWLTENNVYRLNRVPERHRRKFLALIGYAPRPPQAAQTVLSLTPASGSSPFAVSAGAVFEAVDAAGQPVPFLTRREVTVAVVSLTSVQVETRDAAGNAVLRERTSDWHDGVPIAVLGHQPQPGAALYLGFSTVPAEVPIALALHFQGPGNGTAERHRIVCEAAAQRAACRPVLPDIHCPGADVAPMPAVESLPPHHAAHVVWEVSIGPAPEDWQPLLPVAMPARPGVGQVVDDTRSLTLDGLVEVNLPASIAPQALQPGEEARVYLRCRLEMEAYDAPPMLLDVAPNSVLAEQAVPVWQTFTIAADVTPAGPAPTVLPGALASTRLQMQVNAAGVLQALTFDPTAADLPEIAVLSYQPPDGTATGHITLELALVGVGSGWPGQRLTLPQGPVQGESLRLYTHTGSAWQAWQQRADLDASSRTDYHFVLDPMSGDISFGDGERGCVPPAALILATYQVTRAALGNVAAHTVRRLAATPRNALLLDGLPAIDVTNRVPASDGAATEELTSAMGRAVETLHAHERLLEVGAARPLPTLDQLERQQVQALPVPTRAVNLLDIERLALDVPGTQVARARAWAGVHPAYPCLQALGVVTVVILPAMPGARPEPSQGLLAAVKRSLDRRRMVCTRLEVVGPQYLEVRVHTLVRTRPHTHAARVQTAIRQALDAFLDPHHGGPQGLGWPFGRDVYRSEILQVLDGVPGVDHVLELTLSASGGMPQCGNLSLCPTWLVTSGQHQIDIYPATGRRTSHGLAPCPSPA